MNELMLNGLTVPVLFTIFSGLLLWIIIMTKGYWWLKAPIVTGTIYFALILAVTARSYFGWPSTEQLPVKFQLMYAEVKEPGLANAETNSGIFLLVKNRPDLVKETEVEDDTLYDKAFSYVQYEENTGLRFFRLPYSREMHEKVEQAQRMLKKGKPVIGTRQGLSTGDSDVTGREGKGGKKGGKNGRRGFSSFMDYPEMELQFYELPVPKYLPKEPEEGSIENSTSGA